MKLTSKMLAVALLFVAILAVPVGAQAATVYLNTTPTGPLYTNYGGVTHTFSTSAGPGFLKFQLAGYASLDGQNYYEDDFTLTVNGSTLFVGTFNLGGGGANVVYYNPNGATFVLSGQTLDIALPIALINGVNTLQFNYDALPCCGHYGFQGFYDEGWGVNSVQVDTVATPEPATWATLLVGLGSVSFAGLRRQRKGASKTA